MNDSQMSIPDVVLISSDLSAAYLRLQRAAERLETALTIDKRTGTSCDKRAEFDAILVAVGKVRTAGGMSAAPTGGES